MTETIGKVTLNLDRYPGEDYYCDGSVEDEILEIVKKYLDRIYYIHLKDITEDGMFCPLGVGTIDFDPIMKTLADSKIDVEYAVECDGWSGDAGEGARITND